MTRDAQARAWANKVAKSFNTSDVPMEFGLLVEEVGEAFSTWRRGRSGLGGELADEIDAKLAVNETRTYVRLANGALVKQDGDVS